MGYKTRKCCDNNGIQKKIREAEQLGKSVSIKSLLRSELEEKLDIENISNGIIDKMGKLFYYPRINGVKKAYRNRWSKG